MAAAAPVAPAPAPAPAPALAPAGAVWICAHQDGAVQVATDGGGGGKRRRYLLRVPPLPFVREQLVRHGGADFDTRALSRLSSGPPLDAWAMWDMPAGVGFPVMALARVSNHGCHFANGPLTPWDSQSHLQLVMHGHPADAYSVAVDDLRQASGPLALQMQRTTHASQSCRSRISATQLLFRGVWGADAGGVGAHDAGAVRLLRGVCLFGSRRSQAAPADTMSAKALLRAWGVGAAAEDIPVLLLPFPVAYLLSVRAWGSFLLLARWHRGLHMHRFSRASRLPGPVLGWPPRDSAIWARIGVEGWSRAGGGAGGRAGKRRGQRGRRFQRTVARGVSQGKSPCGLFLVCHMRRYIIVNVPYCALHLSRVRCAALAPSRRI
jgi:hypothetical protein